MDILERIDKKYVTDKEIKEEIIELREELDLINESRKTAITNLCELEEENEKLRQILKDWKTGKKDSKWYCKWIEKVNAALEE